MFDVKKFINWDYLTDERPGSQFSYLTPTLIVIGLLFLLAIFSPYIAKKIGKGNPVYQELAKKIAFAFSVTAFAALVLVFFRIENLPILSMRILFVCLLVVFGVWICYIIYWAKKNVKIRTQKYEEQKKKEKYLPKKRD
jgi:Ca2+/Na+ antiporter